MLMWGQLRGIVAHTEFAQLSLLVKFWLGRSQLGAESIWLRSSGVRHTLPLGPAHLSNGSSPDLAFSGLGKCCT